MNLAPATQVERLAPGEAGLSEPERGRPRPARAAPGGAGAAVAEWQRLLGEAGVLRGAEARARYGPNTAAIAREIPLALLPRSRDQLGDLVRIAARHREALYPVSTGRNWGYGCANPVTQGCAIVDLSGLNRILELDPELGLVTVEPGVTQRILAEHLAQRALPFLVPVTGAGPEASLLGNALERGFGITPLTDHFGALMSLEAVLPDGTLYRSALTEAGGDLVDRGFKWGLGPYLDGLFAQGNYGIVTQATLALAPAPERIETFLFSVEDDARLEEAVGAVREILSAVGGVTGAINLMNDRRMLAMLEPYPRNRVAAGGVMSRTVADELAARNRITAWTGAGALYGTAAVVRAARSMIRRRLRPFTKHLLFLTLGEVRALRKGMARVPFLRTSRLAGSLERIEALLLLSSGRPSDIALPLAYWRSGRTPAAGTDRNPSRDGSGLLWYAPLVPLKADRVRIYVRLVERICMHHGLEPLITLTSLSNRCFDSTVPLLFDKENAEESARAHACYEALFAAGQKEGFLPYRLGVQAMRHLVDPTQPCWRLGAAIKRAIDPQGLIAPGRYALTE